jgi:hypothetical protein
MFIPAGNSKIQTQTITHLVKEAPDRAVIYFMGYRTLELTGEVAGDLISQTNYLSRANSLPKKKRAAPNRGLYGLIYVECAHF